MATAPDSELLDAALIGDMEARFGRAALVTLIELYLQDAPHYVRAVTAAVTARDAAALRQHGHDLSTSSGTLGVAAAHRLARDTELACRDGRFDAAFELAARLPAVLTAAVAALRARFPEAKG